MIVHNYVNKYTFFFLCYLLSNTLFAEPEKGKKLCSAKLLGHISHNDFLVNPTQALKARLAEEFSGVTFEDKKGLPVKISWENLDSLGVNYSKIVFKDNVSGDEIGSAIIDIQFPVIHVGIMELKRKNSGIAIEFFRQLREFTPSNCSLKVDSAYKQNNDQLNSMWDQFSAANPSLDKVTAVRKFSRIVLDYDSRTDVDSLVKPTWTRVLNRSGWKIEEVIPPPYSSEPNTFEIRAIPGN